MKIEAITTNLRHQQTTLPLARARTSTRAAMQSSNLEYRANLILIRMMFEDRRGFKEKERRLLDSDLLIINDSTFEKNKFKSK